MPNIISVVASALFLGFILLIVDLAYRSTHRTLIKKIAELRKQGVDIGTMTGAFVIGPYFSFKSDYLLIYKNCIAILSRADDAIVTLNYADMEDIAYECPMLARMGGYLHVIINLKNGQSFKIRVYRALQPHFFSEKREGRGFLIFGALLFIFNRFFSNSQLTRVVGMSAMGVGLSLKTLEENLEFIEQSSSKGVRSTFDRSYFKLTNRVIYGTAIFWTIILFIGVFIFAAMRTIA